MLLDQTIEKALSKANAEQWLELFKIDDIPAQLVKTVGEVAEDPNVIARNMVLNLRHPLGEIKLAGNPVKVDDAGDEDHAPPPMKGEHTNEVLSHLLNYSEEKIAGVLRHQEEHAEELRARVIKLM